MSFLEAMALGRCVIALDMPTMNEYIRHGENGLLYDVDEPLPLPPMREDEVRAMQEAARRSMAAGRVRWERDRQDICRWIEEKYAAEVGPQPRVSIVTCTRNIIRNGRRHWLEQCLRSVREQDYGGEIEHIVIDGASDDGTQELLRHFSGITVVSEPDSGIYDAMNKGLACASGLYVAFLNSDDHYCSPAAVADSVRAMREQDAEASYADAFLIAKDDGEPLTIQADEDGVFNYTFQAGEKRTYRVTLTVQAEGKEATSKEFAFAADYKTADEGIKAFNEQVTDVNFKTIAENVENYIGTKVKISIKTKEITLNEQGLGLVCIYNAKQEKDQTPLYVNLPGYAQCQIGERMIITIYATVDGKRVIFTDDGEEEERIELTADYGTYLVSK
jgi:glycosyltransferase involved in cell wall biosynthesis